MYFFKLDDRLEVVSSTNGGKCFVVLTKTQNKKRCSVPLKCLRLMGTYNPSLG